LRLAAARLSQSFLFQSVDSFDSSGRDGMMQWWPQSVGCRTLDCVGMVHWIFFLFSCWKFFLSDTSRISSVQGSVCFCVFDISWMKHGLVGRHRLQATGRQHRSWFAQQLLLTHHWMNSVSSWLLDVICLLAA
jgi:hypothetical protein